MTNILFSLNTEFYLWLFSGLLSSARIFPLFMLVPYLNSTTVPPLIKFPLILLLGLFLWPVPGVFYTNMERMYFAGLILKELLTGLMLAIFICLPFWVIHAAGSLIDNQRGATISSSLSPQTGIDSSELANFMNLLAVMIVLESGGMLTLLDVLHRSYTLWSPLTWTVPPLTEMLHFTGSLISSATRIASPLITVFLVTELLLGLLGRYTPQLNAFSMALALKSFVGFTVLLLYMSPIMPSEILRLERLFLP